jgi:hypothetical protein
MPSERIGFKKTNSLMERKIRLHHLQPRVFHESMRDEACFKFETEEFKMLYKYLVEMSYFSISVCLFATFRIDEPGNDRGMLQMVKERFGISMQ